MATYAEERKAKAAAKAKRSQKFVYDPVLMDRISPPAGRQIEAGTVVVKIQPWGCPKNGTMGMTYIGDAETGDFIGLVSLNSLKKVGR